jgi:hypothetical protein
MLLGTLPYSYCFWENAWGYRDWREAIRDPRGLYAAFRKMRSLGLDGMTFEDFSRAPVRTSHRGVKGARYHDNGSGRQVIVLANICGKDLRNIRWRCDRAAGKIESFAADEYRFVRPPGGRGKR